MHTMIKIEDITLGMIIRAIALTEFREMTQNDYESYGGVETQSMIGSFEYWGADIIIPLEPGPISVVGTTDDGEAWQVEMINGFVSRIL